MTTYKVTPISMQSAAAPYFFVEAESLKTIMPEIKKATRLADFPNNWSFKIQKV